MSSKGGMEKTPYEALRKGIVSTVDREKCTARVFFPDWDEKVSFDLPVMQKNTLNTKHYWMPEVDEQVICGFFANGTEEGVILGSIYSDVDKVPAEFLVSDDCDGVLFSDGTLIRYDVENHLLTIDVKGDIEIKADKNIRATTGEKIYLN